MKIRIRDRDRRALIGLALAVALYAVTVELVLPQWDRLREAPELAANSESQLQRYRRAILRQGRYEELEGVVAARDGEFESLLNFAADSESLASVELQSIVESVAADFGVVFGERNIYRAPDARRLFQRNGHVGRVRLYAEPARVAADGLARIWKR